VKNRKKDFREGLIAMKQCEFCGATLPAEASFCGKCGHVPSQIAHQDTQIGDVPTQQLESADESNATILTPSGRLAFSGASTGPLRPLTLVPFEEDKNEEDEEEKRRRAALLGLALPLVGGLADQHPIGQVPGIQGTPQMAHMPGLSGTPAMQGGMPFSPGTPSPVVQSGPPMQLPGSPPSQPAPPLPHPPSGHPGGSSGGPSGCLTVGAIIAAAALIILATIIGLGLTVLAPNITLSGSSTVTPGSSMTLHGSNFLPNSSVTLTLDGGLPLYVLRQPAAPQAAVGNAPHAANIGLALHPPLAPTATNVVPVEGDGTFSITFQVNPSWLIGPHTVHATESLSHRSASLSFTIVQSGTSATPTPTPAPTDTPTSTPTATPTPTPSPTPTMPPTPAPTLSCVNPGKLTLGPVSEFSSQTGGGSVTLCTSGSGTLTWQASWDQKQAPWLHMAQKSGSVQAPNQFQASISASAANLAAGTYTATITFIGLESNTTQALTVTFTVQAGCLRVGPLSLSFTTTVGSDPDPNTQTVSMTNCGLTSDWSATAATSDGNNWLSISPGKGTLQGSSSGKIVVTVSSASAKLPANTYTGTVTIKLGSKTAVVTVSLTVDPLITAAPNPVNSNCTTDQNGNAVCTVVLTNASSGVSLSWSASADQRGVTIEPGSDTIPAGGTETVTIIFSLCITTIITFSGPANSASVTWNCTPIE
jgi:ribosomal protein L40E